MRFKSMPIFIYVLIFFITACGPPQEAPPESKKDKGKAKAHQQQKPPTTAVQAVPKEENTETPPPSNNNPDLPPTENPALQDQGQDTVPPNNNDEGNNPPPDSLQEIIGPFSAAFFLNKVKGIYQFPLDVYQDMWTFWTGVYSDALVTTTLVPNPRPQTEQMLIEAVSPQDPFGKFCVVQSNFNIITEPIINVEALKITKPGEMEALHSTSNDGNIVDIDNVKDAVKINTGKLLNFTLEFYGSDGAESVEFNTANTLNDENTILDFDSLCQSCGFEIRQDGLCQQKTQDAEQEQQNVEQEQGET